MGINRFSAHRQTVQDHLTGLVWLRNANAGQWPMTWGQSLAFVGGLNDQLPAGPTHGCPTAHIAA
jgi:hypothetical protein